jgi:glutamine transport system permease protein
MFHNFSQIAADHLPDLIAGALKTLEITAIGITAGFVLGVVVGFIRAYRIPVLSQLARVYVDVIRGTPLLVQIFFIFFGIPTAVHVTLAPLLAGLIAIAINSGAYFSEIIRGAVLAIPRGQREAASAMGLNWWHSLRHVIWPQAFLVALPALGNQIIISVKDTSLLAVISVEELTRKGQIIISATFEAFQIWLLVALLYLVMTGTMSVLLSRLERRLSTYTVS